MGVRTLPPVLVLLVALVGCGDTVVDTPQTATAPATDTTAVDDTTVETTPPTPEAEGVVAGIDFGALDLPPGEPYDGYTELVDDTGTIQVKVPTAWSDTDTAPSGEDEWPYVLASADIDGVISDWTTPGVFVVHQSTAGSEQDELDAQDDRVDLTGTCQAMQSFEYDDGSYTGLAELWTGCASDQAAELVISTSVDGDHLLAMVQMLTEADIDAAIRVIETFSFTGE